MAKSRKDKALRNVAAILTARPKMVGQVSTPTLQAVPLTGPLGVAVKKELTNRAASGDYEHSYRTTRKKKA